MNHLTAEGYAPKDIEMKDCPECDGGRELPVSNCCGGRIDVDTLICYSCQEHADIEQCTCCDGMGEVPKTDDDKQDEADNAMEAKGEAENDN